MKVVRKQKQFDSFKQSYSRRLQYDVRELDKEDGVAELLDPLAVIGDFLISSQEFIAFRHELGLSGGTPQ